MQIYDISNGMSQVVSTWKTFFISIISFMDNLFILPNISLLDFNIALIAFSLIFTAVFAVVRNGVNNTISTDNKRKNAKNNRKHKED